MNPQPLPPPQLHYHIRWSGKNTLDWERFPSRAEAEASARELVLPGETYTVEEHGDGCPQCRTFLRSKSTDGNAIKYASWQVPLWDALRETDPNVLRDKIGRAEAAIKTRLLELTRTVGNHEEMRAIKEGLESLQLLFPNTKQKKDSA